MKPIRWQAAVLTGLWLLVAPVALLAAPPPAAPAAASAAPAASPSANEAQDLLTWMRRSEGRPEESLARIKANWPVFFGGDALRERSWLFAKGVILGNAGEWEQAEVIATGLAARPQSSDYAWLLRALLAQHQNKPAASLAARALTGFEKTCRRGDEARSVAQGCDARAVSMAVRLIARAQVSEGTPATSEAENNLKFAIALVRALDDREELVHLILAQATIYQATGQSAPLREALRVATAEARNEPMLMVKVHNVEAVVAYLAGDRPAALHHSEQALAYAEQAGAELIAARMRVNLVDAYLRQGQAEEAMRQGQLAMPALVRYKNLRFERALRHNLVLASIKLGQFEAARREAEKLARQAIEPHDLMPRVRELRELADAWAEANQYKDALATYHAEKDLTQKANDRSREAALEELRRKYDSGTKQRDLELLSRDSALKDKQLANRQLAQKVGLALGLLLLLCLALGGIILARSRQAQSHLKANQNLLRTQSECDPLTGLSNRRHFLSVMDQLARAAPGADFRGALLMIDIDHFKDVNDRHGHGAGDFVIVEVAQRILQAVRSGDLVVRWGGEEFLVFASELPSEPLGQLADRILRSIGSTPVAIEGGSLSITASIGFASFPVGDQLHLNWEQAVNWIDMALYKAKAEGRNRAIGILGAQATAQFGEAPQDFDAACQRGDVQHAVIVGPPP